MASASSGKFLCAVCGFSASYDYLGKKPHFCKSFSLKEEAYMMKDPFTDSKGSHRAVVLGAHCHLCTRSVCVSQECSLFYTKRFCLPCVTSRMQEFPQEIQQEVSKKIQDCENKERQGPVST